LPRIGVAEPEPRTDTSLDHFEYRLWAAMWVKNRVNAELQTKAPSVRPARALRIASGVLSLAE